MWGRSREPKYWHPIIIEFIELGECLSNSGLNFGGLGNVCLNRGVTQPPSSNYNYIFANFQINFLDVALSQSSQVSVLSIMDIMRLNHARPLQGKTPAADSPSLISGCNHHFYAPLYYCNNTRVHKNGGHSKSMLEHIGDCVPASDMEASISGGFGVVCGGSMQFRCVQGWHCQRSQNHTTHK